LKIVDWIRLTQDRDQWWDLIKTALNIHVQKKAGNILII